MILTEQIIKLIQQHINQHHVGEKLLVVDGQVGPNTLNAITKLSTIDDLWPSQRKLVGYIQYMCTKDGIDSGPIDGYMGPQTEYALEQYQYKMQHGSVEQPWRTESVLVDHNPTSTWPLQNQNELVKFFGEVGTNQTYVDLPYKMKLAWDTSISISRFKCHEKVARPIERVLTRVLDHYGNQVSDLGLDLFGGCLNVRAMRGGTQYSTHSWGIAIDFDPARNKLRWGKDLANFAKPEYNKWFELWEEEGAVSLGRQKNYDWMHIQFCRVK